MYVVPEDRADALAEAIKAAARGEPLDAKPVWLEAFENRDPAVVKQGSIRRRRKEAISAERREEVAGLAAGLKRVEDEMAGGQR